MACSSSSSSLFPPLIITCYSWRPRTTTFRCSTEKPPAAPLLMLPPSFKGGNTVYKFYSLTETKVVNFSVVDDEGDTEVVGSSHGFLVMFHKRSHHLFLYNPISRHRVDLPSIHTLSLTDIGLGPQHMRVTKVVVSDHHASRAVVIFGPANRLAFCCPGLSTEWTPLGDLFIIRDGEHKDARAYFDASYSKRDKMFTCCTDYDIEEWDLRLSRARQQVNLVYQFKLRMYLPAWWWYGIKDVMEAKFKKYLPGWWYDIDSDLHYKFKKYVPWWNGIKDLIGSRYCSREAYVVHAEHLNQRYVVYRYIMERGTYVKNMSRYEFPVRCWDDNYPYKTIGFSVYKVARVGLSTLHLDYMEGSLDNLVMFLGRNHSLALPAEYYPELKPDSIYFTDNPRHTPLHWQTYGDGAHDTAIYHYYDRTFHPIFNDSANHNLISGIEGTVPPLLWFTLSG